MASNPLKIRFDIDNLEALERESKTTRRPITYVVNKAVASRYSDVEASVLLEALNLPKVVRLESTSTTADVRRIRSLLKRDQLRRVVFAVRKDPLNGHCMVAYLEMDDVTVLIDTTMINHARRPREMEVQELFVKVDELNLSGDTYFIEDVVSATHDKTVDEAWQIISKLPIKPFELKSYIELLATYDVDLDLADYKKNDE